MMRIWKIKIKNNLNIILNINNLKKSEYVK